MTGSHYTNTASIVTEGGPIELLYRCMVAPVLTFHTKIIVSKNMTIHDDISQTELLPLKWEIDKRERKLPPARLSFRVSAVDSDIK